MRRLAAAAAAALVLAGCAGPAPAASGTRTTVTVFAAASLNRAFDEVGTQFRAQHPGVDVTFSYLGSAELVDQLRGGAPADVFASADEATMAKAADAGLLAGPATVFATNTLVLIAPAGNPAHVTGLDGSLAGRKLVVCAPQVPCGAATRTLARHLGVTLRPVSEEQKVTDVRGKVESGEADAGIVYTTDAQQAGAKVVTIALPGTERVVNRYPIGVTAHARQPEAARAFVAFVTSASGRDILARYGFGAP